MAVGVRLVSVDLIIQTLIDGVTLGFAYAIAALGLSLVFGVMHVINVAHGDFIVLAAFLSYWTILHLGQPSLSLALFSLIPVIIFMAVVGYVLQMLLVNRVIEGPPLATLLLFFGFMIMMPNVSILVFGPYTRTLIIPELATSLELLGIKFSLSRMFTLLLAITIIVSSLLLLYRSKIGLAIRATAQNREAALICGINVKHVYAVTLSIGLILAGLSGFIIGVNFAFAPQHGAVYTLLSFFVVVLGGMGYLPGTILAGLLVGLAQTLISVFLGTTFVYAFVFLLLYLMLLLRPRGLLGKGV